MTVYLIRHAKAGDRDTWCDDDRLRPLSGRGHRQSRLLVDMLQDAKFDRSDPKVSGKGQRSGKDAFDAALKQPPLSPPVDDA